MTLERFGPLISALIDGELTPVERSEVLAHLHECAECRTLFNDYRRIRGDLRLLEPLEPPATLAGAVRDRARQPRARAQPQRQWLRRLSGLAVAALALLITLPIVPLLQQEADLAGGLTRLFGLPSEATATPPAVIQPVEVPPTATPLPPTATALPPTALPPQPSATPLAAAPPPANTPAPTAAPVPPAPTEPAVASEPPLPAASSPVTAVTPRPTATPRPATATPTTRPSSVTPTARPAASPTPTTSAGGAPTATAPPPAATASPATATPDASSVASASPSPTATIPASGTTTPSLATPSPTAPVKLTPTPTPAGAPAVVGAFGRVYSGNPNVRSRLGLALQPERGLEALAQPFEHGAMEWLADGRQIYVLYGESRTWARFTDTWSPDEAAPPGEPPPPGRYRPRRGFGKVWTDNPVVRERLGWATAPDQTYAGLVQRFERGLMLRSTPSGAVYVLFEDGAWQRFDA